MDRRNGALAGVAAGLLFLVAGLMIGSPPKADDPTAKVVSFLVDKRGVMRLQLVLFGIGFLFFMWFLASLSILLRRAEGAPSGLASLPVAGGVGILALAFAGGSPLAAVFWRGAGQIDPKLVQLSWDANNLTAAFIGIPATLVLLAVAALVLRTGALPAWAGWLALVAAVPNFAGALAILFETGPLAPGGAVPSFVALFAAVIWMVGTAVAMMREGDRAGASPEMTAARP